MHITISSILIITNEQRFFGQHKKKKRNFGMMNKKQGMILLNIFLIHVYKNDRFGLK